MKLKLVRPDFHYFEQNNSMLREWNSHRAPWFLIKPYDTIEEFAEFIARLDDCAKGNADKRHSSSDSYFVIDENGELVGAASLRHYLTYSGYRGFGHICCGVVPAKRGHVYGAEVLRLMLKEVDKLKN